MDYFRRTLYAFVILFAVTSLHAEGDAGGVSPKAYHLTEVMGLPITNSMVTSWVFSLGIILIFRLASGRPKLIPTRGQAVVESLIEGIRDIVGPIVGKRMVKPTFPLLLGFFTFILIHNWSGLLPGVGSFGVKEAGHLTYFYRPANTDLNMTAALAIVSFVAWFFFIMKYAGPKAVLYDLFGNKAEKSDVPVVLYFSGNNRSRLHSSAAGLSLLSLIRKHVRGRESPHQHYRDRSLDRSGSLLFPQE